MIPANQVMRILRCICLTAALTLLSFAATAPSFAQSKRQPPPPPSTTPWITSETEAGLQAAIAKYRSLLAAGGWPTLPARLTMRFGDSDASVPLLRRRLAMTGDMPPTRGDDYGFDENVEAGVKRFQLRHGIEPTGVVYGVTLRALNVPVGERLTQLQINLSRIQELAPKLANSPKYILMNAAGFELQGIENGRVAVTSRIISGKRTTPTPVVSASVQAINTLPYWHVPQTIAKAALIPKIRKDPSYLYKERIRVFSSFGGDEIDPALVNWWGPEAERFVFRQDPGPQNALGLLRFDMPNKHIVYMHDTPMKNLFDYFERAYSAGCIRTQNYLDVAAWVLGGEQGWTRDKIEDAIAGNVKQTIKVSRPVPVHFIYLTAWVEDGAIEFRNDLYNKDQVAIENAQDASQNVISQSLAP